MIKIYLLLKYQKIGMNREKIISNLTSLLKETPTSLEIIKDDKHKEKRFRYLAEHMINRAIKRDALIVSEDLTGIAILFEENTGQKESFWSEIKADIKLALNVTGLSKGLKALKTQTYVKKQRPKNKPHLYCWFWGIMPESRGGEGKKIPYAMKDEIFRISKEKNLPVYAETRTRKVFVAYKWYGFEVTNEWQHPSGGTMWFMKYDPK